MGADEYRVIAWTETNGVESCTDPMPKKDAEDMAALLREANEGTEMRFSVELAQ